MNSLDTAVDLRCGYFKGLCGLQGANIMFNPKDYIKLSQLTLVIFFSSACVPQQYTLIAPNLSMEHEREQMAGQDHLDQERGQQGRSQHRDTYIIKSVVQGDLACYVELLNVATQEAEHYDSAFEWCERPSLVGQNIIATFHTITVTDCESIEPCGKSRETMSLKTVQVID